VSALYVALGSVVMLWGVNGAEIAGSVPRAELTKICVMLVTKSVAEANLAIDIKSDSILESDINYFFRPQKAAKLASKEEALSWINMATRNEFRLWHNEREAGRQRPGKTSTLAQKLK
jgi:hypothetical protein